MNRRHALVALRRLGLGSRPGDLERVASDPKGYVVRSIANRDAAIVQGANLRSAAALTTELLRLRSRFGRGPVARPSAQGGMAGQGTGQMSADGDKRRPQGSPIFLARRRLHRGTWEAEIGARLTRATTTDAPFVERLVQFWSNHFCISAKKSGVVRLMTGAYEREAIRPHVLGQFSDMLRAVEQHPAMLRYLDGHRSIGPNSRVGRRRNKGLNENHAREILELHTVGVDGGYDQKDVTNFARILTGWGVAGLRGRRAEPGTFVFLRGRHEPGTWTVMGRRYEDRGRATGERVLEDLARHPSTARHIARKLATHFVSDNPPAKLVRTLEQTFRDTGGDLRAVSLALANADEVWQTPPTKILPPYDYIVALFRGFGFKISPRKALALTAKLGQPLWAPPSPKGWPDANESWLGPSVIRERLRVANLVARSLDPGTDPRQLAKALLDQSLSPYTAQVIARAEARVQGIELLIMSPAFQRR